LAARKKQTPALFPDLDAPDPPGAFEARLRADGAGRVAGVDEAGRGPLAGPVVAAAVILDETEVYPGVGDSKQMDPASREKAFWLILRRARAVGLGLVGQAEIDRINILQASLKAMVLAVSRLNPAPDFLLIDGNMPIPADVPQRAVKQGDRLVLSIGAASVVAKVVRDRIMAAYGCRYPQYGFDSHKGYGTKAHIEALDRYGPCPLHRMSFRPLRSASGP